MRNSELQPAGRIQDNGCVYSVSIKTPQVHCMGRDLLIVRVYVCTCVCLCSLFALYVYMCVYSVSIKTPQVDCMDRDLLIFVCVSLQNGCVTRLVCWWAFGCLSPCAFSLHHWLASCLQHRERESRVSVFPCQNIAYPQQVLCSAFSWLQVSMGAARPQNRTARAKLA